MLFDIAEAEVVDPDELGTEKTDEPQSVAIEQPATEIEEAESVENILKLSIGAFSLLLLGLSVSAYRKTGLRKVIYAAIAFAIFAIQLFFDFMEDTVESFDTPYNDIVYYAMTLTILVLFFVAIVRRK
jgi:hypothetical protein